MLRRVLALVWSGKEEHASKEDPFVSPREGHRQEARKPRSLGTYYHLEDPMAEDF